MSMLPQPARRPTRLRDFGAFQAGASTPVPPKTNAFEVKTIQNTPPIGMTPLPAQDEDTRDVPLVTSIAASMSRRPSAFQMNSDGTVTMIPFRTPIPEAVDRRRMPGGSPLHAATGSKATKKKWFNLTSRAVLTVVLFVFLLKSLSWPILLTALARVHHSLVLIGLLVGALGLVVSAYQWRGLLQSERIHFDLADLINLYIVGIAFSHFLPTGMGGDAVKAIHTGRESGNNEGSLSAVVMSRITGFFGMLVVATIVLLSWHAHFSLNVVLWFVLLSLLVGGMALGAIVLVFLLPHMLKGRWLHYRAFSLAIRVGHALSTMASRPRALCVATLFGALFWIIACLNYYCYADALGLQVPLYFFFVAIPLISLTTFLPISINGFGVRESILVYVFSTIHVLPAAALLLALLMDAQVLFFGVIGGCIYLTRRGKRRWQ